MEAAACPMAGALAPAPGAPVAAALATRQRRPEQQAAAGFALPGVGAEEPQAAAATSAARAARFVSVAQARARAVGMAASGAQAAGAQAEGARPGRVEEASPLPVGSCWSSGWGRWPSLPARDRPGPGGVGQWP